MFEVLTDPNDDRITVFPDEFFVQIDGASDNRAVVMFCFCELLVRYGLFDRVRMSFLIVGHTHNDVDQTFAAITFQLRKAVVKSIHDLVIEYKRAYSAKNQPSRISIVEAVPDFTTWLVEEVGLPFAGCSRRTSGTSGDIDRPHTYEFCSTGDGGCEMYYKNLTVDETLWNKDAVQLLRCLPDAKGPQMQKPGCNPGNTKHLQKLLDTRANVLLNFDLNNYIPNTLTEEDRLYVTSLFDSFSAVQEDGSYTLDLPRLRTHMASKYDWKPLPEPFVIVQHERGVEKHKRPAVEPITHSKFTESERQKALKAVAAAEVAAELEAENKAEDNATAIEKGKARGAALLSKAAQKALDKYSEDMNCAVSKTNAKKVHVGACIVGVGTLANTSKYALTNFQSFEWLPANEVDLDTLDDLAVGIEIIVWWNDGTSTGIETPYAAKILSHSEDAKCEYKVRYSYDDSEEMLNLATLESTPMVAPSKIESDTRTAWIMRKDEADHNIPTQSLHAQLRVLDGASNAPKPLEARDGLPTVVIELLQEPAMSNAGPSQAASRPSRSRTRKTPDIFMPDRDGLSDQQRKRQRR